MDKSAQPSQASDAPLSAPRLDPAARSCAPRAVLFDFDGTLVDSAPDLAHAINRVRAEAGLPPMAPESLRPHATYGARSLLRAGLGLGPDDPDYARQRERFLSHYDDCKLLSTQLFSGVIAAIEALSAQNVAWGIVTNKLSRFANPIIQAILEPVGLMPDVVICGDSTQAPKPDPLPLVVAAERLGVPTEACWFVGDGENDLLAAQRAGMTPVLATYGYLPEPSVISIWLERYQALRLDSPAELVALLDRACQAPSAVA
ncbi:MAG: HAD-IA family hydrolase [Casimicrobiaceae bacterium]|nr:HAD-IA family hydrolase [Casimicrobiaceae bacterium]MCX8098368.1 HAD-IA family hydrolase [Casimicrobiaceae bacterium]MDW8312516.1 HAD-IA family hydrolase [Burkholderiales bacterium]